MRTIERGARNIGLPKSERRWRQMQIRVIGWPAFRNKQSNPYNFLLYTHLKDLGVEPLDLGEMIRSPGDLLKTSIRGAHILHLHWPEYALNLSLPKALAHLVFLFGILFLHRLRGGKVVWTVHNLSPHENKYPFFERSFYRTLSRVVDGLIFLTQTSHDIFQRLDKMRGFQHKPIAIIPHGHYAPLYPSVPPQKVAKREIGLAHSDRIILFFGAIRPYKGVEEILDVAQGFAEEEKTFFIIAGRPLTKVYKKELDGIASDKPCIRMYLEHISEEKVPLLFGAADLVLLPYRRILNSGTAFLALTFGKPIMAPRQGSLVELEQRYPSLVYLYDAPLTKEKVLLALEKTAINKSQARLQWKKFLADHGWMGIARQTLLFYARLLKREAN